MSMKQMRRKRKFSRTALGAMVGVTGRAIASYETGDRVPAFLTAKRIADVFGITLDQFYAMFVMSYKGENGGQSDV